MGIIEHIENLLGEADIKFEREEGVLMMQWKTDHFEDLKVKSSDDSSSRLTNCDQ